MLLTSAHVYSASLLAANASYSRDPLDAVRAMKGKRALIRLEAV